MYNSILRVNDKVKKIDDLYFKNYGGANYTKNYQLYTKPAEYIIQDLLDKNIYFHTLLDIGCASGELVRDLRRLGVDAYGIENNEDILKKCVVPKYCLHLDMDNLEQLPLTKFDIIYTNSMMYCFPQNVLNTLQKMHNICQKAVCFYNPFLKECSFKDPYRVFLASRIWWEKQFEEANFKSLGKDVYAKIYFAENNLNSL